MRYNNKFAAYLLGLMMASACQIVVSAEEACFNELAFDARASDVPGSNISQSYLKLNGIAAGGQLVLFNLSSPNPMYCRIETEQGEAAEIVLERMAAALNEEKPFSRGLYVSKPRIMHAEGNRIGLFGGNPGEYLFAGTEIGLSIPPPPSSLTAIIDAAQDQVSLTWENPESPYDAIRVSYGGIQPGTATSFARRIPQNRPHRSTRRQSEQDIDRREIRLRRFWVVGCRGGVLSNAGVITWDYDDNSQVELDVQPFTGGISPNWKSWSYSDPSLVVLEQGNRTEWKRSDGKPRRVLEADDKRFYQLIKTRSEGAMGGVYRKFMGLKAGHTYRIATRMNTMDTENAQENWSFSFHAIPHSGQVALTPAQMAGMAALPDGSRGWSAAQIVSYGLAATTDHKFKESSTAPIGNDTQSLDITIPPGAETITVWFRCSGKISSGVGFDWIKLKDVTLE